MNKYVYAVKDKNDYLGPIPLGKFPNVWRWWPTVFTQRKNAERFLRQIKRWNSAPPEKIKDCCGNGFQGKLSPRIVRFEVKP